MASHSLTGAVRLGIEYRDLSGVNVHFVNNSDEVGNLMRWLGERHANDAIAFDTETGGLEWWNKRLRLVQFGDTLTGWSIPWDRWGGVAVEVLQKWDGQLIAHNAKFDTHFLRHHSGGEIQTPWDRTHDTAIMAHLLEPTRPRGLKPLAAALVNPQAVAGQAGLEQAVSAQKWTWDTIPIDFEMYWAYGALDTVLTAHLYDIFKNDIAASYSELYGLEMAVSGIICKMEAKGMRVDVDHVHSAMAKIDMFVAQMQDYIKAEYPGAVNAKGSPTAATLTDYFQSVGVPLTVLTDSGKNYKMDKEVLASIDHPLAEQVVKLRQAQKINGTYLGNFLELRDSDDLLHCSVNTLGARTGRMSISDPALQTLPRDSKENPFAIIVRDSFIPRYENVLVSSDFDQVEMRLLCHFAETGKSPQPMLEAIMSGDLHTETARRVYNDPGLLKKDPRRQLAKNAGFAKIYGAGLEKFALTAKVSVAAAKDFLDRYDIMFPDVRVFQRAVEAVGQQRLASEGQAYVKSPIGRFHPTERYAIYKLTNYLIQGTAADVLKQTLVDLDSAGFGDMMLLPVHDEIIFDVPRVDAEEMMRTITSVMKQDQWLAPLTVEASAVERWGDKYR